MSINEIEDYNVGKYFILLNLFLCDINENDYNFIFNRRL